MRYFMYSKVIFSWTPKVTETTFEWFFFSMCLDMSQHHASVTKLSNTVSIVTNKHSCTISVSHSKKVVYIHSFISVLVSTSGQFFLVISSSATVDISNMVRKLSLVNNKIYTLGQAWNKENKMVLSPAKDTSLKNYYEKSSATKFSNIQWNLPVHVQ